MSLLKSSRLMQSISFSLVVSLCSISALAAPNPDTKVGMNIGKASDPVVAKLLPDYSMNFNKKDHLVALVKKDGTAKAFMQIMPPVAHLSTTKAYAQSVMDSYAGWGLKAQIARRGFSFSYVDNAPCSALISYFDGASYVMFGACGLMSKQELAKAYFIAKQQLGIDEQLFRSALTVMDQQRFANPSFSKFIYVVTEQ